MTPSFFLHLPVQLLEMAMQLSPLLSPCPATSLLASPAMPQHLSPLLDVLWNRPQSKSFSEKERAFFFSSYLSTFSPCQKNCTPAPSLARCYAMVSESLWNGAGVPKVLKGNERQLVLDQVFILYEMRQTIIELSRKGIQFYNKITQVADNINCE